MDGQLEPWQVRLPADVGAPRRARRVVAWLFAQARVDAALTEQAVLLVSELVTNAVVHARSTSLVRVTPVAEGDLLRVEVDDDSSDMPRVRDPSSRGEGGWGLVLVDRLANRWGANERTSGKTVWFELSLGLILLSRAEPGRRGGPSRSRRACAARWGRPPAR